VRLAFLVLVALLPVLAPAATGTQGKKAELKEQRGEVRSRIKALNKDLAKSEESRAEATDQLKETESAISATGRKLHQLAEKRQAVQADADDLKAQGQRLDQQIQTQQAQLSRLLYRHYTRGENDALQLLLAGRDPNQAALDSHFLKRLSEAKADLIGDLRDKAKEKKRLTVAAQEKNAELSAIEEKERLARDALLDQQKQKQALLASLSKTINAQRQEIGALQHDEKRLTTLIATLGRSSKRTVKSRPTATTRPEQRTTSRNERKLDPNQSSGTFASLKGRLHLPVRGQIANRFGKARPEGGTTWKGLLILAPEGTEVKSVAAGQVVYADWLRGFGNLLVVDHGDGFLSVYGNNQSLLRETGEDVKAGEAVATVGSSGGNPESGLYFELRYQGQAFDPLRWVSLR
jgi:septal ring factor EnvC (AmiA/AmiB activator)